tara:strand:- start:510 stop:713 length:204 start_codon:yes stop_codon:yes gene_type:complete
MNNNKKEKQMTSLGQMRRAKTAERAMWAAKKDWHLRRLDEAYETKDQHDIDRHEKAIQECELKLRQM